MTSILIAIISFLIIIIYFGRIHISDSAEKRGEQRIIDREYPYFVNGYGFISNTHGGRHNFKTLEKAKSYAKAGISDKRIDGRPQFEKYEICYNNQTLESNTTDIRVDYLNDSSFSKSYYRGAINKENHLDIDLLSVSQFKKIYLQLSDGCKVRIEKPSYSIVSDALFGVFIHCSYGDNRDGYDHFYGIPISIIQRVEKIV